MKLGGPAAPCAAVMGQWGHLVAACLASFPRGADNSRERDLHREGAGSGLRGRRARPVTPPGPLGGGGSARDARLPGGGGLRGGSGPLPAPSRPLASGACDTCRSPLPPPPAVHLGPRLCAGPCGGTEGAHPERRLWEREELPEVTLQNAGAGGWEAAWELGCAGGFLQVDGEWWEERGLRKEFLRLISFYRSLQDNVKRDFFSNYFVSI